MQRYAPPAPPESSVDARLDEIRQALCRTRPRLTRVLDDHGFTDARLRAWVRDDLRTQAYLAQRFASASTPTDAEIAQRLCAASAPSSTRPGLTFEQATPIVRERLVAVAPRAS